MPHNGDKSLSFDFRFYDMMLLYATRSLISQTYKQSSKTDISIILRYILANGSSENNRSKP